MSTVHVYTQCNNLLNHVKYLTTMHDIKYVGPIHN